MHSVVNLSGISTLQSIAGLLYAIQYSSPARDHMLLKHLMLTWCQSGVDSALLLFLANWAARLKWGKCLPAAPLEPWVQPIRRDRADNFFEEAQILLQCLRWNPAHIFFYQSVVACAVFFGVASWGNSITVKVCSRLDKLIRKWVSVMGGEVDYVVEKRVRAIPCTYTCSKPVNTDLWSFVHNKGV